MSNLKISQLTQAFPTTIQDGDSFPIARSGTTRRLLGSDIKQYIDSILSLASPRGVVMPFASNTTPTGWLICNGNTIGTTGIVQGVDASLLQNLRNYVGTAYGALGTLPDLRGVFVRGYDNRTIAGGSRDPDRNGGNFGVYQADILKSHTHAITFNQGIGGPTQGPRYATHDGSSPLVNYSTITQAPSGGTETRPSNIALLYCIRY